MQIVIDCSTDGRCPIKGFRIEASKEDEEKSAQAILERILKPECKECLLKENRNRFM